MSNTPEKINLKRYMGTWKQISVRPVPWFQKGCKDVKAHYKLRDDGKVDVINICDGRERRGVARSVSDDNKELKVSFFPLISGEYNIVKLDKDYKNVTVKGGKYTWKLQKCDTKKC
jgi:apolipoprotein D and lipocalin family protein